MKELDTENLFAFVDALEKSWSKETAYNPAKWSEDNKAIGQCVVSSLIFQDYFGGKLVKGLIKDKDGTRYAHYWNTYGKAHSDVDLTWQQFDDEAQVLKRVPVSRKTLLKNADVKQRYELLKQRVDELIGEPA